MTREEALNKAINIVSYFEAHFAKSKEAREYAANIIEALEQEPCEDCISRQAVIDEIEFFQINPQHFDFVSLIDNIKDLPSVNPQKPKMGHWKERRNRATGHIETVCSECGAEEGYPYNDYCGNCGAQMVEPQESEEEE